MEWYRIVLKDDEGNITILDPMKLDGSQKIVDWARLGSVTSNTLIHLLRKKPYQVATIGDYLRLRDEKGHFIYCHKRQLIGIADASWRRDFAKCPDEGEINSLIHHFRIALEDGYDSAWNSPSNLKVLAKPYKRKLSEEFAAKKEDQCFPSSKFYIVSHSTKSYVHFQRAIGNSSLYKESVTINPIIGMTIYGEYVPVTVSCKVKAQEWIGNRLQILYWKDIPREYRLVGSRAFIIPTTMQD